jgi:acyl-CoA reductase-like NAD-dependent aldehyde dehydrogenase
MALVLKEPYGVVVGMAPWNAALLLGLRAVATPIACGNTVVCVPEPLSLIQA